MRTRLRIKDADRYYWCDNVITSTHESTHAINSMLRQRTRRECYYVFHGHYMCLSSVRSPSIAQVAGSCRYRGQIFNLYLVKQRRWWNNNPLYLFDEWTAYTNGAATAMEYPRGYYSSSLEYALEMAYYCRVMLDMLPRNYRSLEDAKEFYRWNASRLIILYDSGVHRNSRQKPWYDWLKRTLPTL